MNPVAIRELEERFRTVRSPILLSIWVLVAGALTFLAYLLARSAADAALSDVGFAGIGSVLASNSMGVFIFEMVMVLLMTGVVFVVPGQAAVTIVGERERQTLQLLQVSQLSPDRIVTGKLLDGAQDCLERHGCAAENRTVVKVPGSWELPLAASKLAKSGKYDAVVALGALVRGETPHFDLLAAEVTKGLAQVSLDSGVPVIFGVLTADTVDQAIDRAGAKAGNKGWDAALSAIEMVDLYRRLA